MHVVAIDEAAFVPVTEFEKLAPQLVTSSSMCFIISSPPINSQHWSMQLGKSHPDILKFLKVDHVCEDCQRLPSVEQMKCTHMEMRIHAKQSSKKRARMGTELNVNAAAMSREIMAHLDASNHGPFREDLIGWMYDKTNESSYTGILKYITVYVDPSGYGQCLAGFCAITTINQKEVILALDARHVPDDIEYERFVLDNIFQLSKTHRQDVYQTPIFVAYESNGQDRGAHMFQDKIMANSELHFTNVVMLGDPSNPSKCGIYTLNRTHAAVATTKSLLRCNAICFHKTVSTKHPEGVSVPKKELRLEMELFRHFERGESLTYDIKGHKRFRRPHFSGKVDGHNDDAIVALIGSIFWHEFILESPFYGALLEKYHLSSK